MNVSIYNYTKLSCKSSLVMKKVIEFAQRDEQSFITQRALCIWIFKNEAVCRGTKVLLRCSWLMAKKASAGWMMDMVKEEQE